MQELNVTAGDKLFDLDFTLSDAEGDPVDISGATIVVNAQHETGTTLAFTGTATIVSGTLGTCTYNVKDGDIDDPGRYYAEIQVEFSGGGIQTFGYLVIIAKRQLPRSI